MQFLFDQCCLSIIHVMKHRLLVMGKGLNEPIQLEGEKKEKKRGWHGKPNHLLKLTTKYGFGK